MCNECDSRHKEYIKQGREEFRLELMKEMQRLWAYYLKDKENVPRPDLMSVLALMDLIKDRYNNE